ncbi:MAG: HEPN domain-containing protein [Chloroflexota bacterium]|nr:HEPN domain-containing protein [Chloroflexota bacterium]
MPPEQAWFAKADDDLEVARRALGPGRPLPALACYHAQQSAEKYLRATSSPAASPSASSTLPSSRRLQPGSSVPIGPGATRHPVHARLPGAPPAPRSLLTSLSSRLPEPDIPKAQDAIHQAQRIADFVLQA